MNIPTQEQMEQKVSSLFPATEKLRVKMLADTIVNSFEDEHTFTEVFNALAHVVGGQCIAYLISEKKAVNEANLIVELQKFLNLTGRYCQQLLEDKNVLKTIKEMEKNV